MTGRDACKKHIFRSVTLYNGKEDATKLLTFGTRMIVSEYVSPINYLTN